MKEEEQVSEDKHEAALLSVFPSVETVSDFKRNDPDVAKNTLPAFARFAHEKRLIPAGTEAAFLELIRERGGRMAAQPPPPGFDFGDLMDKMAGDASVNHLVDAELKPIARRFGFPDAQASMISRMRKKFNPNTRAKKNLLRVLAFWLGVNRPYWGWNYETLLTLGAFQPTQPPTDLRDGVRMAVHVAGHNDLLDPESVVWLKNEMIGSMKDLDMFYVDAGQVVGATTTVYVNIPRTRGRQGDLTLYARALRDAVALAHQMVVRWNLSNFSGVDNRIVIALAAGPFVDLEMYIQAMLKASQPEGAIIRMTPFAHMCANLAEIKLTFNPRPREVALYDGGVMTVWSVDSLWTHIYYDFAPPVLEILPSDPASHGAFKSSLFADNAVENPALAAVYKHAQDTLLILEIAKTCVARGLFHESDRFLSIILANHPFHVAARTMRIVARMNIALCQSRFSAAHILFTEAVNEGTFIIENCRVEDEEPFCELGQVHYCIARRLFNILRNDPEETARAAGLYADADGEPDSESARTVLRRQVMAHLKQARDCFETGRTISPSGMGNRSLHWSFRIYALIRLLETDGRAFEPADRPDRPLTDRFDIFRGTAKEFSCALGWTGELPENGGDYSEAGETELFTRILSAFELYDNAVQLRSYGANVKYAFAILLFDFAPRLTVGLLKMMLAWLSESENQVRELRSRKSKIRTIVTCYSQIQPADMLFDRIRETIRFIKDRYAGELERPDDHVVESGREFKFTLKNFTEEVFPKRPFF